MSYNILEIQKAAEKAGITEDLVIRLFSKLPKKRSSLANRSLHKLFYHISDELNELGHEFIYKGLKGSEISTRWTPELVKNMLWRPIQITLIENESTTKLTSKEIQEIFYVLERWFAEKGVQIVFPSESEDYRAYLRGEYKL